MHLRRPVRHFTISLLVALLTCQAACRRDLQRATVESGSTSFSAQRILIITKGQGGDAEGASVLRDRWGALRADLLNLSNVPSQLTDTSKYACILLIGQGAVDVYTQWENRDAIFRDKEVGIYSHLIDERLKDFLKQGPRTQSVDLFRTESQLSLLASSDVALYTRLSNTTEGYRVWSAPLVIKTVPNRERLQQNIQDHALVSADAVIWLGGGYADSLGNTITFDTTAIVTALRPLLASIRFDDSVAIMLIPRLFGAGMSIEKKQERLVSIRSTLGLRRTRFYASPAMAAELNSAKLEVFPALLYSELMRLPWNHAHHFASVDQFNLFADLDTTVLAPFLLDPSDKDQALYAADYVNRVQRGSLSDEIWLHGCQPSNRLQIDAPDC